MLVSYIVKMRFAYLMLHNVFLHVENNLYSIERKQSDHDDAGASDRRWRDLVSACDSVRTVRVARQESSCLVSSNFNLHHRFISPLILNLWRTCWSFL